MLTAVVRTLPESNSGIFLRGFYEIQIAYTYGKSPDSLNMGALYSRITPSVAAERPVGEWQTIKIILVSRHVSVWLNGVLIIDNQPALGCTGGALTSNEFIPGPIMLQGDSFGHRFSKYPSFHGSEVALPRRWNVVRSFGTSSLRPLRLAGWSSDFLPEQPFSNLRLASKPSNLGYIRYFCLASIAW